MGFKGSMIARLSVDGDSDEQPGYKDTGCYRYHKGCSEKSLRGVISAELLSLREPRSPFIAHRLYTRR